MDRRGTGRPRVWFRVVCVAAVGWMAALSATPVAAQRGTTWRVSVSSSGAQGNRDSSYPSISADGRYVAFHSDASNLVSGDTNLPDVFVHDRQTGQTSRVSVSSTGAQGNGNSWDSSISADGRYVAFFSLASNLVAGDTNGYNDVFVHDRQTGQTSRVSVSSTGAQGNGDSRYPSISADGRYVAFDSGASNLVSGDTNGYWDVFVHQYGSGGGGGNQGGGNTGGDPPLRDRRLPRDPNRPAPIVLVNGLSLSDGFRTFLGGTNGHLQWQTFKNNFVAQYGSRGYSVYDPVSNLNGNLFIVENLNTFFGVNFNAGLLDIYLQGVSNAPAMRSGEGFDIVGYSMGGLIARRWEQLYDNPNNGTAYSVATKRVRNIVTIATPHMGSFVADGLLMSGLIFPPSVFDLTSIGTLHLNAFNPGLPGARYSRIAADLDLFWPLRRHDGVVAGYSSLSDTWLGAGYPGSTFTLNGYAHSQAAWLGLIGVLNDIPAVTAVYGSIYGTGTDSPEAFLAAADRVALMASLDLLPNALLEREVPISTDALSAGFQAQWDEGSAQVTLVEPGGRIIDPSVAKQDPNIERFAYQGMEGYQITDPVPGVWRIRVLGGADIPTGGTRCDLTVKDDAPCDAQPTAPRLIRLNARARFLVELRTASGTRLLGGSANGTLVKPDLATLPITLYDDGMHGDGGPNDGLFGSDEITGNPSGSYTLVGHVSGGLPGFGSAQRMFTVSFSASPETGRITGLKAFRPVDDPADVDAYYDILNADINVYISEGGSFTLAGELHDAQGRVIDTVSKTFDASTAGTQIVTLPFPGAVIGEHDKDGPFVLRNVSLTHNTDVPMLTDYVSELATTGAYSRLLFETIHPRTVAPTGRLRLGFNMISLPLEPLPGRYTLRDILGPNFALPTDPAIPYEEWSSQSAPWRGKVLRVFMWSPLPETVAYLGTEDGHEFEIAIPSAGVQRVGCPYNGPLPLSRTLIKNNATGEYRTAEQDASNSNPWVNWSWRYFDNGVWKYLRLQGGDDDHLRPWVGYEVTFNIGNLTLILRD